MSTAFKSADILLPVNVNMEKWAVAACDQYTSEPEYWESVREFTKGENTALDLILPEVWLEEPDVDKRIEKIHQNMKDYIASGVFKEYKDAMIYVERIQSDGMLRAGIVGAIDLEEYDFSKGSKSAVRATEATVAERIPPRMKIRRGAEIELPHIMILIDDKDKTVIEPVSEIKNSLEKLYDSELMKNGGHITGYLIGKEIQKKIISALEKLGDIDSFNAKYGLNETSPLVYAMGDGNHSLATAKEFYEELKKNNPGKDFSDHPARYALAEIVDLHSPALEFEAIHRIVTGVDAGALISEMTAALELSETEESSQSFTAVINGEEKTYYIHKPTSKLTVGSLQNFIDGYISQNKNVSVDYIHGTDTVRKLAAKPESIGFLLPDMSKSELFPTVICDGALPRKTFSMGHAQDKRFYIESRFLAL